VQPRPREAAAATALATRAAAAASAPSAAASKPRPAAAPADAPRASGSPDRVAQPAGPLSRPDIGELARRLNGQRFKVLLTVDAEGAVRGAAVRRYELSLEVARQLEEALLTAHLAPRLEDGAAVPYELETLLCFNDEGAVDTTTPGCLQLAPAAAAPAPGR